jgi:DNA-binding CsgD family transcriptional regulator
MSAASTAQRRERDLVRRCYAGLDAAAFRAEAARSLRALLDVDAVFFAAADPVTLLFTGAHADEPLGSATGQFLDNEFGHEDVNKFQSLTSGARRVATLDEATHGRRADSARFREIMAPLGLGDELRAALVTQAGCWGYLCLHRAASPYGFSAADVRLVGRLAPHLAHGCRSSLTAPAGAEPANGAPGVIVLHPDLSVAAMTDEAERWISQLPDARPDTGRLPVAVTAVAARLQGLAGPTGGVGAAPSVRVRTGSGTWVLVHASPLRAAAREEIAIVLEAAPPSSVAPVLLSSHGLTARERDVALLVLRGASTSTIGTELHLSPYTVKDHLKSVFDKTGVRSRRDLVSLVLMGGRGGT